MWTCSLANRAARILKKLSHFFHGDFLTDFYLEDSNPFEEWAETWRQALRRQVLDALETLTLINTRKKSNV